MKERIKPFHWWQHTKEQRNGIAARWFDKKFGENTGYGIYNKILEIMLCADGCIKNDEIDLYSSDISAVDCGKLKEALSFGVEKGIFYNEDGGYRCEFIDGVYAHGMKLSESMKREPKSEVQPEPQPVAAATPDPEPKKPKQPNPAPEIIEHWNANAKSLRCKKLTSDIEKAVAKRCKEYTIDEIKQGIENYHAIVNDPDCFFSYKWNIAEFLSRANGFPVFYGDRDEIIGKYRKSVGKNANPEQPKTRKELLEAYK